ncbi:hypothetical protein H0H87_007090 [Tephrocybe sp. NHM501043]|nr:hypothetical protein H0H87_007090 [Tephrocybe sp. NHM501043]
MSSASVPRLSISLSRSPLISQLLQVPPAPSHTTTTSNDPSLPALCSTAHSATAAPGSKPLPPPLPQQTFNSLDSLIRAVDNQFTSEMTRIVMHIQEARDSIQVYRNTRTDRQDCLRKRHERFAFSALTLLPTAEQPIRKSSIDDETRRTLERRLSERPDKKELVERNVLKDDKGIAPSLVAARQKLERSQLEVWAI